MPKLRTAWRASGSERRLALRAWLVAVAIAPLFRTLGTVRCQRLLQRVAGLPPRPRPLDGDAARQQADAIAWGLKVALRNIPWRVLCLERSQMLQLLLARAGVAAQIRIGVRKAGEAIEAHAWVEVAGEPLDDSTVADQYSPFDGAPLDGAPLDGAPRERSLADAPPVTVARRSSLASAPPSSTGGIALGRSE